MDWTAIGNAVVAQVIMPAILVAIATVGGWLVTRLPGPLKDWLASGTHERDMQLILGVLARGALSAIKAGATDKTAVAAAVSYAATNIPETLNKLGVPSNTLQTMASAAVVDALAKVRASNEGAVPVAANQ